MKLVLAEKPSVAQSLAKVLGANKRCDGYLEGNGYIVSWCVGHLVELSPPEAYDETYAKWRLSDLPILPATWKYQVSASTRKQFGILKKLMKRDDVESLVCATDAGREGELIFRLVYHQAGCRKPFERLWISSMEDQAIKDGFSHLEPSTKYDALYEAALCRERADWIVGMNATRLFSCLYHQTLNVGRVMTPTLAMVVMRDAEIAAFKPKPFYTVQLGLNGITAASRRFDEKGDAQQLLAKCKETMKAVIKSMDRKEKTERAPLLYDLTSLQRDANRILGFTAQQTLDYTQALYEKKLVTYPRTDSRYLTDDMKPMLPSLISQVAEKIGVDVNKGKTLAQSLGDRTDYAKNPEKTDKGELVTGYQCDPMTVDEEFMLSKRQYEQITGRRQRHEVIAYQIRQSFKPGEITPEEANRLGQELALRFTKGKYAFIVATHTDRAHVHNHIVFNSTSIDGTRKFKNFWLSSIALQKVSDLVCLENGLSVIAPKPYRERAKRTDYPRRVKNRDVLCEDIDTVLQKKPESFEAFLQELQALDYEIKYGKHISVKGKNQARFIRLSSLEDGYTEADLRAHFLGQQKHKPRKKRNYHTDARPFNLVIDIQSKLKSKGAGYQRWASVYNLKQMSKTLLFLRDHKIESMEQLDQLVRQQTAKRDALLSSILSFLSSSPASAFQGDVIYFV